MEKETKKERRERILAFWWGVKLRRGGAPWSFAAMHDKHVRAGWMAGCC